MSYRYMRIIVFFDLPTETNVHKKSYREFRSFLIKKGFLMLQESVYCKMTLNQTVSSAVIEAIKKNRPKEGLVQILTVTEKQFSKMEYICGEKTSLVLDTDERLVVL